MLTTWVWSERGPPELMPTAATHVIAASIFHNALAASWTLLHDLACNGLAVVIYCARWMLHCVGSPLVLAHETHDRVGTKVTQAKAITLCAFHLNFWWI